MRISDRKYITLSLVLLLCAFVLCPTLGGCGSTSGAKGESANASSNSANNAESDAEVDLSSTRSVFAMDTYMTLTAYGSAREEALDEAVSEIERLETLFNAEDEESEIYILNDSGTEILSEETGYLLERSLELYESTDGLFDIAIYPLMQAWGFTTLEYTVPDEDTLSELLKYTDASQIQYDSDSLLTELPDNMKIDLGGIAKGYTSARIMDIFEEYGLPAGVVSLGGNVQVYGAKSDGSAWNIAIQDPDTDSGNYLGVLSLAEAKAVITSGGYERYFEEDGVTYHHILDPRTGYPADSGILSSTIVSSDGTLADGLSTALYIMGVYEAASYWRERSDEFDFVLLDESGTLYVSEGISDCFSSDLYDIEIITKE